MTQAQAAAAGPGAVQGPRIVEGFPRPAQAYLIGVAAGQQNAGGKRNRSQNRASKRTRNQDGPHTVPGKSREPQSWNMA